MSAREAAKSDPWYSAMRMAYDRQVQQVQGAVNHIEALTRLVVDEDDGWHDFRTDPSAQWKEQPQQQRAHKPSKQPHAWIQHGGFFDANGV